MTLGLGIQWVINVGLGFGFIYCLIKMSRGREEDRTINQGLRLLKSKISVLEDLSEHTESQSAQVLSLLEKKTHEVKSLMGALNQQIRNVDQAIYASEQMAKKLTQDLPHGEIVEENRQKTYREAAQAAHRGASVDDLVEQWSLPRAEAELIVKVNRKKCVFDSASDSKLQDKTKGRGFFPLKDQGENSEYKAIKISDYA